jgi:hypothetical protein
MHAVVIPGTFNDRAGAEAELPDLVSQVSAMPLWLAIGLRLLPTGEPRWSCSSPRTGPRR